jgi:hypothetical protein
MQFLPFVLMAVYLAICIFVLVLLSRFVSAHERMASAAEDLARNFKPSRDAENRA